MTSKNAKTVLFASLIAVMILPFLITNAYAEEEYVITPLDELEYFTSGNFLDVHLLPVDSDTVVISLKDYTSRSNIIKTFDISSNGTLTEISSLHHGGASSGSSSFIKLDSGYYALVFNDYDPTTNRGQFSLKTFAISDDGININEISSLQLFQQMVQWPQVVQVDSDTLVITYTAGVYYDTRILTVNVSSDGIATEILSELEYAEYTSNMFMDLVKVDSNTVASGYYDTPTRNAIIKTFDISSSGTITELSSLQYDGSTGQQDIYSLVQVDSDTIVLVNGNRTSSSTSLKTLDISAAGIITEVESLYLFNGLLTVGNDPFIKLDSGVFALSYTSLDGDAIKIFTVSPDGTNITEILTSNDVNSNLSKHSLIQVDSDTLVLSGIIGRGNGSWDAIIKTFDFSIIINDDIPPEITLLGNNTVNIDVDSTYTDAGATATDDIDGDITANIVTNNPVDTSISGNYTITYDVADSSGNNATQVTRTVIVSIPLTITAPSNYSTEATALLTPLNSTSYGTATAIDDTDPNPAITNDAPPTFPLGDTTITWAATDSSGKTATATQIITVQDTTNPTLMISGYEIRTIDVDSTYTDAGATASDIVDGDITSSIVITGSVDTSTEGTYHLYYDVSDSSGNPATQVIRTIGVHPFVLECPEPESHYNIIYGTEGNDRIDGTHRDDLIFGYGGNDTITGDYGNDCIYGGEGNDTISGEYGNDTLRGGYGDDHILGNEGNDSIYGGYGEDDISGDEGNDYISGGGDDDTIYGNEGNDYLNGAGGNDYIKGNEGDDNIHGNQGDDYLFAGTGYDTLYGDSDLDICQINGESEDTTVSCETIEYGKITTITDCNEDSSHYNTIIGTEGDDVIDGTDGDDLIFGLGGNDTINGNSGNDCIYGGNGNDTIDGNSGFDYIFGGDNDDVIRGSGNQDYIYGGAGNDILKGNNGRDHLFAGIGYDALNGGDKSDTCQINDASKDTTLNCELIQYDEGIQPEITLLGNNPVNIKVDSTYTDAGATALDETDGDITSSIVTNNPVDTSISGNYTITYDVADSSTNPAIQVTRTVLVSIECEEPESHYNIIYGTEGDDVMDGTDGDDLIFGLGGNDTINGNEGNDCIYGGNGSDDISGGTGNDHIYGGKGNDIVAGWFGNDYVYGNKGNDYVYGGWGNDTIYGNQGDDYLFGSIDYNAVNGGWGSDICKINGESEDTTVKCEVIEY